MVTGNLVTATGLGAVAFASSFPPILAAMVLAGGSDGLVDVVWHVVFQRRSPDAVRSRVMAAVETVFLLGLATAFPAGAVLVGAVGPKAAYAVAGVGCAATALLLVPLLREARATVPPGDRALE
jgi:predicted MFS family arabinose efflux permease